MSTENGGTNGGDLPFARTLFEACDRLRGSVESAEYKHLVLGSVFLKYASPDDVIAGERARVEATGVHLGAQATLSARDAERR